MGKSKELATLTDAGGDFGGNLNVSGIVKSISGTQQSAIYNYQNAMTIQAADSGNAMPINFYNGGTNTVAIDASGRVTMPYQPYAHVRRGSSSTFYSQSSSSTVPYQEVITSRNLSWNTSTGGFTVPVTGVYAITAALRLESYTGGYMYMHIQANGANVNAAPHYLGQPEKTDGFATQQVSTTVHLIQNDAITFFWSWSGGGTYNCYGLQTYVSVAFIG